jgi:hypothetical protein
MKLLWDSLSDPQLSSLMTKSGITTRAQLKTFITAGTLPAAATISAAVFQRALLVLCSTYIRFAGETDANAGDLGV